MLHGYVCFRHCFSRLSAFQNQIPLFDLYTTFQDLQFEEGAEKINFCDANAAGINVFFTDLDGSLSPKRKKRTRPSTAMSNVPTMTNFVDKRLCMEDEGSCYLYCKLTCFRAIQYEVDPAETEDYMLRVCEATDSTNCVEFPGYVRFKDPTSSFRSRTFITYLPKGKYTSVFVNQQGQEVWPSYVTTSYQEDELCPAALKEGDVQLIAPVVTQATCTQLLRNQDFEASSTEAFPWLHRWGGIEIAPGTGMGGSNALTSEGSDSTNTIVQFLDMRCLALMVGERYEITAWVKLEDESGQMIYRCDPSLERCPEAGLDGPKGRESVALVSGELSNEGYQLLKGTVEITESIASADQVSLFLRSNQDLTWFVDNVSMQLVGTPLSPDDILGDFLGEDALVTIYAGDFP
jgi:hypothetical protein